MNIDFKFNPKRIEVLDHAIRNMSSIDEEGVRAPITPHIQVRCIEKSKNYYGGVFLSLTYKDKDGKFLGLDEGSSWKSREESTKPITITTLINIPEGVETAECEVSVTSTPSDFYSWSWKAGIVLVLLIIVSWLIKSLEGLLW